MSSEVIDHIKTFMESAGDTFKLFANAIEDWKVYSMTYYAIRSGDWSMRLTGKFSYSIQIIYFAITYLLQLVHNNRNSKIDIENIMWYTSMIPKRRFVAIW